MYGERIPLTVEYATEGNAITGSVVIAVTNHSLVGAQVNIRSHSGVGSCIGLYQRSKILPVLYGAYKVVAFAVSIYCPRLIE